jgi:SAM-dependent methyltransferase
MHPDRVPPPDQGPDDDAMAINRTVWTETNARYTDARAGAAWQEPEIAWGCWQIPEEQVRVLPAHLAGLDVVELGCGTAYLSAWLARRGARPVGVDPTPAQLASARRCQRELGLPFPLVEAPAERVPLPDAAFDLAISEYGASIWADPYLWVPEAARLLRPGGRLVFLRTSTLAVLCSPDVGPVGERLARPQFGLYRLDWRADGGGIEFHLGHGELLRLLRASGFEVLDLIELQAPPDAQDHPFYDEVAAAWARQWPAEEIWVAQKRSPTRPARRPTRAPGR